MRSLARGASLALAAGAFGSLVNSAALQLLRLAQVQSGIPLWTPAWIYPRLAWGALFGRSNGAPRQSCLAQRPEPGQRLGTVLVSLAVRSDINKRAAGDSRRRASGRFLLRLDPGVHAQLRAAAAAAGLSLNDYCARRLAAPASGATILGPATAAVSRAGQLFGGELAAVLLFGSWARDEAGEASDVDLLVVLDRSIALNRELYRRWDEQPLDFEGRAVEAHFAHFPESGDPTGGLWAEAAIDGVVLFERGFGLSRFLVRVRREILAGRLMRRTVQGQHYWVEVA